MNPRLRVGQVGITQRNHSDSRAQLFNTPTPSSSGRSTPIRDYSLGTQYSSRSAEEVESQNDERIEGLTAKVKLLKEVTVAIGSEVKDSATQLSQMNDAFAETSGILSGTFNRLKRMSSRQGCRYLWYIMFLVLVFWFFIVVWWWRR